MLLISYRIANWLYRHHFPILPKLMYYIQRALFKSSLPATCIIGAGTTLGYGGIGIVVHARTVIGKNCMIGQGVTIGGKSGWYEVPYALTFPHCLNRQPDYLWLQIKNGVRNE